MLPHLIIIFGPSGSGKNTVSDYLRCKYNIPLVITHTTRSPRYYEKNGEDYYFENNDSMDKLRLIEKVKYNGYQYGSSMEGIERASKINKKLVQIILDSQGAITYLKKFSITDLTFIFITTSDKKNLIKRMIKRGDSPLMIYNRINSVEFNRDLILPKVLKQYTNIIFNDNLQKTKNLIDKIILNIF